MANNVGNISVGLSLDNQSFASRLESENGRVMRFTGSVQKASLSIGASASHLNKFGGSLAGLAPMFQQAAFGIGDFASQVSTRGFGGGLQAAANNIQMLGAGFGPMGLAVSAGIGVATSAIGVYIESQEKAAKKQKEFADGSAKMWAKVAADAKKGAEDYRFSIRQTEPQNRDIRENARMFCCRVIPRRISTRLGIVWSTIDLLPES